MRKIAYVIAAVVLTAVTGCGTVGGAVSGAGQDMGRAGEWIRSR